MMDPEMYTVKLYLVHSEIPTVCEHVIGYSSYEATFRMDFKNGQVTLIPWVHLRGIDIIPDTPPALSQAA